MNPPAAPEAGPCEDYLAFVPDASQPIKTIRMSFWIMQREAPFPKGNFDENVPSDVAYLHQVFDRLNTLYAESNAKACNGGYVGFLDPRDTRIRFELEGIHYVQDDLGWTNGDGSVGDFYCAQTHFECPEEILHVYFCESPTNVSGVAQTFGNTKFIVLYDLYDDYNQNGPTWWGHGNLLGHEVGHHLGLWHSWSDYSNYSDMCQNLNQPSIWCDPFSNPNCTNNMMGYAVYNDFISPLQMSRMHYTLSRSSQMNRFVKHEYDANQSITINNTTEWEQPRFVWGDVILEPGAELTISCIVTMPPGGRIITKRGARLIIDGGRVTSSGPVHYDCGEGSVFDRWTGIEVWGNPSVTATPSMLDPAYNLQTDDPGVVIIINNGIVERAERGIYGQMRGNTWAVQQQHFGGLISVNEGQFKDCRKAVEYFSSAPLSIPSTFRECIINQSYLGSTVTNNLNTFEGVTSWQVSGLIFTDDCQFNNLERGITLGNASAEIQNSTFNLCQYGIYTFMPWTNFNQQISVGGTAEEGNLFKYCHYAILSQATGRIEVNNNTFEDCSHGFIADGTSWYSAQENTFKNLGGDPNAVLNTGVAAIHAGALQNFIFCNTYQSGTTIPIKQGIYLGGANSGTYFDINTFACQQDVYVVNHENNPGVLPNQNYLPTQQNSNLFSPFTMKNHVWEIFTPNPTLNQTKSFNYYPPTTNCSSNYIPRRPYAGTCFSASYPYLFHFVNEGQVDSPPGCSESGPEEALRFAGCGTLAECLDSLNTRLNALNGDLEPGASLALQVQVVNAPSASSTLQALLAASPYLAEDILASVALSGMTPAKKVTTMTANLPLSPYIRATLEGQLSSSQLQHIDSLNTLAGPNLRDQSLQERYFWEGTKLTWMHQVLDSLYEVEAYTAAEALLVMDTARTTRQWLADHYVFQTRWDDLDTLLLTWPFHTLEDTLFRQMMNMGISMLTTSPGWQPAPADSLLLDQIANGPSASAGHARALIHVLYDRILDPVFVEYPDTSSWHGGGELRSYPGPDPMAARYSILPNPTTGQIQILCDAIAAADQFSVTLLDALGTQVMFVPLLKPGEWMDVSDLRSGIYFLILDSPRHGRHTMKMVRQ